jgi:hypothetical protein
VRVVELADEFELTTAQALDVCDRAGIPAADGSTVLTTADIAAFRAALVAPPPPTPPPATVGAFAHSVPLPPERDPAELAAIALAAPAPYKPSYKRERPMDSNAILAIVLAFLPFAILYLGWAGWVFAIPTFVCARNTRHNVHRRHGELRGGTLAFIATFVVVMTASFSTVWVLAHNTGLIRPTFHGAVDDAVNAKVNGGDPGAAPTTPPPDPNDPNDPNAPKAPGIAGGPVEHLLTGDCINSAASRGAVPVMSPPLTAVSCDEPHDAEVLQSYDLKQLETASGSVFVADGPRPPQAQLTGALTTACRGSFVRVASGTVEGSLLAMIFVLPTEADWDAGKREVACAIGTRDGSRIAGPATPR